ncbi:hypothetical protein H4R24_002409 [Coemansia sp. RSA 988]|nr:hypothetical protein H4R24_002409 [Coemansia sp. RSA 988]
MTEITTRTDIEEINSVANIPSDEPGDWSIVSIFFEKQFISRPTGVVSKNRVGVRSTACSTR